MQIMRILILYKMFVKSDICNYPRIFHRLRLMFDVAFKYVEYYIIRCIFYNSHLQRRVRARERTSILLCMKFIMHHRVRREGRARTRYTYVRKDALQDLQDKRYRKIAGQVSRASRQNIHNGRMKFRRVGSSSIRAPPLPGYDSGNNLVSYRPRG